MPHQEHQLLLGMERGMLALADLRMSAGRAILCSGSTAGEGPAAHAHALHTIAPLPERWRAWPALAAPADCLVASLGVFGVDLLLWRWLCACWGHP